LTGCVTSTPSSTSPLLNSHSVDLDRHRSTRNQPVTRVARRVWRGTRASYGGQTP
jgi:hypothetical protein